MTIRELLLATVLSTTVILLSQCTRGAGGELTGSEQIELKMLTGQLADTGRSAKTKREAAELLLMRPYTQAAEALRDFLADSANRPAQVAVAEAIAGHGGGRKEFVEPLMAMLTGEETSVRVPAARALATYKNHGVTGRLVTIALDRKRDKQIRMVTISALQRILDKTAVDALVRLLAEPDPSIQAAAADALAKLTNIRAFGTDRRRWIAWWNENKDKDRSEWLADLADSLARANASLESENAQLRDRLARAMRELYAATPPQRREAMLLSFLKDPLPDVRLVGTVLTDRRIGVNEQVPPDVRQQVRTMLADPDPRLRRAAALLVANLGDGEAMKVLLARLEAEEVPAVRAGLLTALGQLRDPKALEVVLKGIDSKYAEVSAAAAAALARVADRSPLEGDMRTRSAEALVKRYRLSARSANGAALREALLTAMGVVRDAAFVDVLEKALKDEAATVRLAAVRSLARMGQEGSAATLAPLVDDADRGVRQAAIVALGTLSGTKHLQTILQRTAAAVESDAAVRQQAWDVVMGILAGADVDTLKTVMAALAKRGDAPAQRIKVTQMLVAKLKARKSPELPTAERDLGLALRQNGRPAEAVPHLAEAHRLLQAAKDPRADAVWVDWIDALLAADDPTGVKAMAGDVKDQAFAEGLACLTARLKTLEEKGTWSAIILLAGETVRQLSQKLTAEQQRAFQGKLDNARKQQQQADRQEVSKLVPKLSATDESARQAAASELKAMGDRAVAPLLEVLKESLQAENPDLQVEKAILPVLRQIAPELTGYSLALPAVDRIKLIESWVKNL